MSRVLIGVLDEPVSAETFWDTSKIGGKPDIYSTALGLPVQLCAICKKQQSLITQVYSPLNGSVYHRTLYIFSCTSKSCWNKDGSWRVLRLQKADESTQTRGQRQVQVADPGVESWCTEADDWGDGMKANDWCQEADDWGEEEDTLNDAASQSISEASNEKHCGASQETVGGGLPDGADKDTVDMDSVIAIKHMVIDDISDNNTSIESEGVEMSASHCVPEDITINPQDSILGAVLRFPENGNKDELDPIDMSSGTSEEMTALPPEFKSFYISVIEEPNSEQEISKHERHLLADYAKRDNVNFESFMSDDISSKKKKGGTEGYEKTSLKHGDKIFHKFKKQLLNCPEQLLRYSWAGEPLHIRNPENLPTKCHHCHGPVVFEMQLMPALVNFLSTPDDQGGLIEFGTVLVFSCKDSCWEENGSFVYREETVIVEPDPDQHLFKF